MNIDERNLEAKNFVNSQITKTKLLSESNFPRFSSQSEVYKILTDLIEVQAKGFRGVALTAIVGLYLNENYDPLNNFYGCNPRPIFENGIWYALNENNIPCGKSDPLNVAKNTNQLDENWAQGRRPQKAAIAAVKFIRKLLDSKATEKEELINYFFFRLVKYARSISSFSLASGVIKTASNQQLSNKLIKFILSHPESGHMPQYLIAKLLEASAPAGTKIKGGSESVFGTNTTSKKPADIWTEINGNTINLYEVTVKKIDLKRLEDCLGAMVSTNNLDKPVTFICRIPEDTGSINITNNVLIYKTKTFDFVDIRHFVAITSALLSPAELRNVINELEEFVNNISVSLKTKRGWNSIF